MKAVRLLAPGSPLELCDVPVPQPGPHDVLLRVRAVGICHSDAHYRAGTSPTRTPVTLGHEIAGTVEATGESVFQLSRGDRVSVHYLATCGGCAFCRGGHEQFCGVGQMLGKHRDGGFAEFVLVPAASVLLLPATVSFEHGAVMMCSSATALHALRKARLARGETVAIFGIGGLGASAVQLARALGAAKVYAVDLSRPRLELAATFGAIPVKTNGADAATRIRALTDGRGVDVAIELVGLPETTRQAVLSLAPLGRAAVAGITTQLELDPYRDLIGREAEVIGVSDHLMSELPELLAFASRGALDLSPIVTRALPLDADAINGVLDELARFGNAAVRTVVVPALAAGS
jgi:D-arabinose 1-dehydrogenase-like Zn-dependent alcohol dehydrogenase